MRYASRYCVEPNRICTIVDKAGRPVDSIEQNLSQGHHFDTFRVIHRTPALPQHVDINQRDAHADVKPTNCG